MRVRPIMDITVIMAEWILGDIGRDDLWKHAIEILAAGHDTPSLRMLAMCEGADAFDQERLLKQTLSELNYKLPSKGEAVLIKARLYAAEIVSGRVDPLAGARRIWRLTIDHPHCPNLGVFGGCVAEHEDADERSFEGQVSREHYFNLIKSAAQSLMTK